jgi:hypothetical protein
VIPNCEDACPPDASATRAARAGTLPTRDLCGPPGDNRNRHRQSTATSARQTRTALVFAIIQVV